MTCHLYNHTKPFPQAMLTMTHHQWGPLVFIFFFFFLVWPLVFTCKQFHRKHLKHWWQKCVWNLHLQKVQLHHLVANELTLLMLIPKYPSKNKVNTMAVDILAACAARPSAAMVLIVQVNCIICYPTHRGQHQWFVQPQCSKIIGNKIYIYFFPKINSARQWLINWCSTIDFWQHLCWMHTCKLQQRFVVKWQKNTKLNPKYMNYNYNSYMLMFWFELITYLFMKRKL